MGNPIPADLNSSLPLTWGVCTDPMRLLACRWQELTRKEGCICFELDSFKALSRTLPCSALSDNKGCVYH